MYITCIRFCLYRFFLLYRYIRRSCCNLFSEKFMSFACRSLNCFRLRRLHRFQLIFIDFIHKTACFNFLSFRSLSFPVCPFLFLNLAFLFFITLLSCLLFSLKFLLALNISGFCICFIIIILRFFFQKFRNYIQNYQEKDGKSENNKSLYAFCCKKEISCISYCDHNLRYVILHLNGNRFCIFVTGIYHLKNMILFIHFRNHITVCFRISLIQNRITNRCLFDLYRNCISNRSHGQIRFFAGIIHNLCRNSQKRRNCQPDNTDNGAYHYKMYNKFQKF